MAFIVNYRSTCLNDSILILLPKRQFYVDYPSFIETFLTAIALVQSNVGISVRLLHPWQE